MRHVSDDAVAAEPAGRRRLIRRAATVGGARVAADRAGAAPWRRSRAVVRTIVALAISGALTVAFVVPLFRRIDLFPVPYLMHPALRTSALAIGFVLPLVDAALVWLWGAWAVSRILRRIEARWWEERAPARRRFSRAAPWLLVVVTIPPAVLAAISARDDVPTGFGAAYRDACSGCHSDRRALSYLRSPEAWKLTIERHRRFAGARLSEAQAAAALAYLTEKRSASGAELFRFKCLGCHEEATIRAPRPPAEWARIIERTARFNPFQLSPMEARELLAYIEASSLAGPAAATPAADRQRMFETACGQCHTLDVALLSGIDDAAWPAILVRMADKAPAVISEDDARGLAPWILAARRDPDAFRHRVPHNSGTPFFRQLAK